MRSVALSVVFVILLTVGVGPVAAAGGNPHSESLAAGSDPADAVDSLVADELRSLQPTSEVGRTTRFQTDAELAPSTTMTINLRSDQSADWQVVVEYELTSELERDVFSDVAADFESGTATDGLDVSLYENIAALSSERTGRTMRIQDVDRSSSLEGDTGRLSLSFTWTEFLREDGEKLVFNDALRTPTDDSWLTSISETQEIRVTTPRGYAITSANVAFSDNTVTVTGPHTFDSEDHIRITLEPSRFADTSAQLLGAAVVVAAAIISGALLLRRQDDGIDAEINGGATMEANGGVDTVEPTARPESGDEIDPEPDGTEPQKDLSLLADDERVLRLLERNGGRMRQAKIVSETKWSDAKVSQLLSSMADDGEIEKLRIGRENLISLPNVDALNGSPTDDTDEE